jgi:hypothetical protein
MSGRKLTRTKNRQCVGKKRNDTRQKAEAQMWRTIRRYGAAIRRLHVYRCDFCGGWHVGHTDGRSK